MPQLVKRTEIIAYLNTGEKGAITKTWSLVGNKTTDLSYSYNPQETTEQYVVDDVASTTLDGYQLAIDGEMKCYFGDAVYDYINGLRYNLSIGDSAVTEVLLIDKYDKNSSDSSFKAQTFECTVSVNSYGGAGGETPTISYKIGINGNPTQGSVTFTGKTPTFTPTVSA